MSNLTLRSRAGTTTPLMPPRCQESITCIKTTSTCTTNYSSSQTKLALLLKIRELSSAKGAWYERLTNTSSAKTTRRMTWTHMIRALKKIRTAYKSFTPIRRKIKAFTRLRRSNCYRWVCNLWHHRRTTIRKILLKSRFCRLCLILHSSCPRMAELTASRKNCHKICPIRALPTTLDNKLPWWRTTTMGYHSLASRLTARWITWIHF